MSLPDSVEKATPPAALRRRLDDERPLSSSGRWIVLAACLVTTVLRAPQLLLAPRLVAEEATVYLAYAFGHDPLRTLLLVPTSDGPAGYLHLVANLGALLANALPMELAAGVTTGIALLVQLLPIAVLLWGRSRFWGRAPRQLLACLLLVIGSPFRPEVWLQIIQAQVWLGIVAFLLLFENLDETTRLRRRAYRLLLLLGGLTGAYTVILAPVYLLRAYLRPSREARAQATLVTLTALVQGVCLVGYWAQASAIDRLASVRHPSGLAALFLEHLVQPWVGMAVSFELRESLTRLGLGVLPLLAVVLLVLMRSLRSIDSREARVAVASLVCSLVATSILAHGLPVGRYAVVSGSIVLLLLVLLATDQRPARWVRWSACAGLLLATASGLLGYWAEPILRHDREPVYFIHHRLGHPSWAAEVAAWRQNPYRPLAVWPYTQSNSWTVLLSPADDFRRLDRETARADQVHLVLRPGQPRSISIPIGSLPPDFRIVVEGHIAGAEAEATMVLKLFGDGEAPWFTVDLPTSEGSFTRQITVPGEAAALRATRSLEIEAAVASGEATIQLQRVQVVPRIRGLLDPLLPAQSIPPIPLPASRVEPRSGQATVWLATSSVDLDGDALYQERDRERAASRWTDGPVGLTLREPLPAYDLAGIFLQTAAAVGLDRVVLGNLLLLFGLAVIAVRRSRGGEVSDRLFAFLALPCSLIAGWALLPTSTLLELCCLALPLLAWSDDSWNNCSPRRAATWGALLAIAATLDPFWALLPLALLGYDLAGPRRLPTAWSWVGLGFGLASLSSMLLVWWSPVDGLVTWRHLRLEPLDVANVGLLYSSRQGWFLGFPFSVAAALALLRRNASVRPLYGATLALALANLAAAVGPSLASEPLSHPRVAIALSLLALMPRRLGSWYWTLLPSLVALLWTWRTVSRLWSP